MHPLAIRHPLDAWRVDRSSVYSWSERAPAISFKPGRIKAHAGSFAPSHRSRPTTPNSNCFPKLWLPCAQHFLTAHCGHLISLVCTPHRWMADCGRLADGAHIGVRPPLKRCNLARRTTPPTMHDIVTLIWLLFAGPTHSRRPCVYATLFSSLPTSPKTSFCADINCIFA